MFKLKLTSSKCYTFFIVDMQYDNMQYDMNTSKATIQGDKQVS